MRRALPVVKAPVLLAHSRQDGSIPPKNMQQIYEALGAPDKQMLWVEQRARDPPRA